MCRHYSASRMALVVQGRHTLDEMEHMVTSLCSPIPNSGLSGRPHVSGARPRVVCVHVRACNGGMRRNPNPRWLWIPGPSKEKGLLSCPGPLPLTPALEGCLVTLSLRRGGRYPRQCMPSSLAS